MSRHFAPKFRPSKLTPAVELVMSRVSGLFGTVDRVAKKSAQSISFRQLLQSMIFR
jgi:hypothetical protein